MSEGNGMRTMLMVIGGICLVAIIAAACVAMTRGGNKENMDTTDNLSLVTENANEGIANLPLGIYLTVTDYKDGIATVQVDNQSGYEMKYTTAYILLKETNGEWVEVPLVEGATMPEAVENPIKDLEKATVEVDLTIYEKIEAGTYRLVMGDNTADFTLQ